MSNKVQCEICESEVEKKNWPRHLETQKHKRGRIEKITQTSTERVRKWRAKQKEMNNPNPVGRPKIYLTKEEEDKALKRKKRKFRERHKPQPSSFFCEFHKREIHGEFPRDNNKKYHNTTMNEIKDKVKSQKSKVTIAENLM